MEREEMTKPEGRFKCCVCGKECDGSELYFDPQRAMWSCSDIFCGANVYRIEETKTKLNNSEKVELLMKGESVCDKRD